MDKATKLDTTVKASKGKERKAKIAEAEAAGARAAQDIVSADKAKKGAKFVSEIKGVLAGTTTPEQAVENLTGKKGAKAPAKKPAPENNGAPVATTPPVEAEVSPPVAQAPAEAPAKPVEVPVATTKPKKKRKGSAAKQLAEPFPRVQGVKAKVSPKKEKTTIIWELSDQEEPVVSNDIKYMKTGPMPNGGQVTMYERIAVKGKIYVIDDKTVLKQYRKALDLIGAQGAALRREGREVLDITATAKDVFPITITVNDREEPILTKQLSSVGHDDALGYRVLLINDKQYIASGDVLTKLQVIDKAILRASKSLAKEEADTAKEVEAKVVKPVDKKSKDHSKSSSDGKGRVTIMGCAMTAVIRWMGNEEWSFAEVKYVLEQLEVEAADNTIRWQLRAGRKEELPLAELDKAQKKELNEMKNEMPEEEAEKETKAPAKKVKGKKAVAEQVGATKSKKEKLLEKGKAKQAKKAKDAKWNKDEPADEDEEADFAAFKKWQAAQRAKKAEAAFATGLAKATKKSKK